MWPYIGAALVGAWWVSKDSPRTKVIKSQVVGARSGQVWDVEFFEDLGSMIVMKGPHKAVFRRTRDGWENVRQLGNRQLTGLMIRDFAGVQPDK